MVWPNWRAKHLEKICIHSWRAIHGGDIMLTLDRWIVFTLEVSSHTRPSWARFSTKRKRRSKSTQSSRSWTRRWSPCLLPLLDDSWQRIKGVVANPSLRELWHIGHQFTDEIWWQLRIGGGEDAWKPCIGFHHLVERGRVCRPYDHGIDGDFHGTACTMEDQLDSGTKRSHLEVDWATQGEDWHGNPRTSECAILELAVHSVEKNDNLHFI